MSTKAYGCKNCTLKSALSQEGGESLPWGRVKIHTEIGKIKTTIKDDSQ